jgi:hypothetical protein
MISLSPCLVDQFILTSQPEWSLDHRDIAGGIVAGDRIDVTWVESDDARMF